jgi:hypothetical protein
MIKPRQARQGFQKTQPYHIAHNLIVALIPVPAQVGNIYERILIDSPSPNNGSTALAQPWHLLQFHNNFYTDGRTPWTGDKPVARPLSTHRTIQTQNKRIHGHPCPEYDSNPRSQRSSKQRMFMPDHAATVIGGYWLTGTPNHCRVITN